MAFNTFRSKVFVSSNETETDYGEASHNNRGCLQTAVQLMNPDTVRDSEADNRRRGVLPSAVIVRCF